VAAPIGPHPVALVTGSSKGLGRALAEHLLTRGYRVFGCSRTTVDWSADGYTHLIADVTDEGQVKELVRQVSSEGEGLYAVVNNAGAASMNHALLTPATSLDRMLATNVRGAFLVCREAAKAMRGAGVGRIVNISTIAVPLALEGQAAYVASKGAVESLSRVLAVELAGFGVTVNVIGATPIDTDMTRGVPARVMERLIERLPIARMGTVADVANVLDFFLDPASDGVTGQILYLGGVTS